MKREVVENGVEEPKQASLLTDDEKWHFELQGYLVLRDVVSKADLGTMRSVLNGWLTADEKDLPEPVKRGRQEPNKTHIGHIHYGHEVFQRLNMNPHIIRVVAGLTWGSPRLMHCVFTHMVKGPEELRFHRDDDGVKVSHGFRNPNNDFQVADGEIYCSHLATWIALSDVPVGTGFCLVPGSHKSTVPEPEGLTVEHNPPVSITIPLKAGDAVIFSTRLLHNASPWTQDYPRLNIFQRYVFSWFFDLPHLYPLEDQRDKLSDDMYELEKMTRDEKQVVKRVRERLEELKESATPTGG